MLIFESVRGEKIPLKEIRKGHLSFYLCGPTVYDFAHLGHGRSVVAFDLIRRYFIWRGFNVFFVSNFTDIDDKMIVRAKERNLTVVKLAEEIIPAYLEDYAKLNILPPDSQPLATEYISTILELIEKLENSGFTYRGDDGIYFEVEKFRNYGAYFKQNLNSLFVGARIAVKDFKKNPQDFVLWKFKKTGEPFWFSKWGDGRPGWHIECSAMTYALLGEQFDIHAGGLDLKFPHHECEIAQSKSCFGENSFARYWLHNGFVEVNNEKMSKSLGNFFTLRDLFKLYSPLVLRFSLLQTHYRRPIAFSDTFFSQAENSLKKLRDFYFLLHGFFILGGESSSSLLPFSEDFSSILAEAKRKFIEAMDDDFEISQALAVIFNLITELNLILRTRNFTFKESEAILNFFDDLNAVLAIFPDPKELDRHFSGKIKEINLLLTERENARKIGDFAKSDILRSDLEACGCVVEDGKFGQRWRFQDFDL